MESTYAKDEHKKKNDLGIPANSANSDSRHHLFTLFHTLSKRIGEKRPTV